MSTDQLPVPSHLTEARGVHQSDIVLRAGLVQALASLRINSWLLDYVFASLVQDDLTSGTYGAKEAAKAKAWFLKTDIPVVMDYRLEAPEPCAVSITLVDSTEAEPTVGDTHYEPTESTAAAWTPLTAKFTPTAWVPSTGIMTVSSTVTDSLVIAAGMQVVTTTGRAYAITEIIDASSFKLTEDINDDFGFCTIRGTEPRLVTNLESLPFRETYKIGVHVHGEPFLMAWLHSIVVFALLHYKETLFEARGIDRSTISTGPFAKDNRFGVENYWTRFISMTGYVRHYWPKTTTDRILSVGITPLEFSKTGEIAPAFLKNQGMTDEETPWLAQDGIGLRVE